MENLIGKYCGLKTKHKRGVDGWSIIDKFLARRRRLFENKEKGIDDNDIRPK